MAEYLLGTFTHDAFMEEARKFHGYPAPGIIIGAYMVEMARRALPEGTLFDVICESQQCIPDAVQILTACTIGNCWLRIHDFGLFAMSLYDKHTGKGVRVHLDMEKINAYPEIRAWFLKEKPKAEQNTERLQEEIRQAKDSILTLKPIQIKAELMGQKGKKRVGACPSCQECYPLHTGEQCLSCQGKSPYEA